MKHALFVSSLALAATLAACGSKSDKAAPAPAASDTQKAAMQSEYQALPAGAVVRVQVDENGNELKDSAEMRYVSRDLSNASNDAVSKEFDNGVTSAKGTWNAALQDTSSLGADAPTQSTTPAYGNPGYDNQGNPQGGYTGTYDNSYGYSSYRPYLFSRILRGAAWVLSRPFVWTARTVRYYYYSRPACGCYSSGNNSSTYVDANGKDSAPQPYAPQTTQPAYTPAQTK